MKNIDNMFLPAQNFAGLSSPFTDFDTAKAIILPVPYDSTTEWHSGTREGPMAIINASPYLEMYDLELDREIYKAGIHTFPAIQPVLSGPENMVQRIYTVTKEIIEQNKFLVMLGGEHSLSLGAVKAFCKKYPDLTVLQFDAHADLRNEYLGTSYNNACVMRRILEYCPITQIGIRSLSAEEHQFLTQNNMKPFYKSGIEHTLSALPQILNSLKGSVYITIDLDVFDPSVMSAVGTPEPDGLQWEEVTKILREVCQKKHVVGFDLMELCPAEGPSACAYFAAKLAYKLIGYALAEK
jgi:agmatinase